MEATKSYGVKNNNFTFAVDRLYDAALLFLMCIVTAHNSRDEGKHYIYYAAFFIFIAVAAFRAILYSYLNLRHFRIPIHTLWYGIFILLCLSSILWARSRVSDSTSTRCSPTKTILSLHLLICSSCNE